MKSNGRTKAFIIIFTICAAVLLIVLTAGVLLEDSSPKPTVSLTPPASTDTPVVPLGSFTALVEEINLDSSSLVLYNLDEGVSLTLEYNGATDFQNRHGRIISASLLTRGYIADVSYDTERLMLLSLHGNPDSWEYHNIGNLIIDADIERITVSENIYRYDDRMHIMSGDTFIDISAINSLDVFTLTGIDNYVYLIKVVSGHGYLELANYEDFVGGTISLGRGTRSQVTEDMRLTLSEGTYNVTVENNEFSGNAEIRINRDKTAVFDLAEYGSASIEYGEINFGIRPEGTELYIDGVRTLYDEPVKLTYGLHTIEAVLGGYTPYEGSVDVSTASQIYNIALSENPDGILTGVTDPDDLTDEDMENQGGTSGDNSSVEIPDSTTDESGDEDVPGTTPTPTVTQPAGVDVPEVSSTPTPTPTPVIDYDDSDYNIVVRCTENAAVYANNIYVGTISGGSVSFTKQVGTLDLRLELEGYVTKNYTVEVESGNFDAVFSFPDMVSKN